MSNKLSFSAITTYNTCGRKYQLHYKSRLRSKYFHAALAFGSAIDESLNELLLTRDLKKATLAFDKKWHHQYINDVLTNLAQTDTVVYSDSDLDEELLSESDIEILNKYTQDTNNGTLFYSEWLGIVKDRKKQFGWANLSDSEKQFFNYLNWMSLRQKGHTMLSSYNEKVMPKIKNVLAVQHKTSLVNEEGDEVVQILDLVAEWDDGSKILFDNKTSAREYDEDSASMSPQLISYYHKAKIDFGVTAVGFIVLRKQIMKNKVKVCSVCKYDGSGSRAKTCDSTSTNEKGKEVRCNGEWDVKINPEALIQIIVNQVSETAEDLVLSTFDEANIGIRNQNYSKNLSACKSGPIVCQFFKKCWANSEEDLIVLPERQNKD